MKIKKKWLVVLGLVGILGHMVGIAADLFSGFVPTLEVELGVITSLSLESIAPLFVAKSLAEARIGHYLAVLFIPLGIAGIIQIFFMLKPQRNPGAYAFLGLGSLGVMYGTFYHGTLAFVIAALQAEPSLLPLGGQGTILLLEYVNSLSEPFSGLLLGADILVSVVFIWIVMAGRTAFAKWMAAFNPLSIQLVLNGMLLLAPAPFDQIVWLTVFNSSLAIWFMGTTISIRRSEKSSAS